MARLDERSRGPRRASGGVNLEQAVTATRGVFARASVADGRYEAYEFTDVDRSVSAGVSIKGTGWRYGFTPRF